MLYEKEAINLIYLSMKKYVVFLALLGSILSCARTTENSKVEIDIQSAEMISSDSLNMLVDQLDFIIVDTAQIYFSLVRKIISDDSIMIILVGKNRKEIVIMDQYGHLNARIDYIGSGPGEYKNITDITYNFKTKEIIVFDIVSKNLYTYNLKGQYISQKKIDLQASNCITDDEYYYFFTEKLISELGKGKEIIVLDKNCNLVNSFFEYKQQPDRFRYSADQVFFRNERSEIFFSNVFRDTTYRISSKECKPSYIYNINNKIPTRYTIDRDLFNNNFRNYNFHSGLFGSTKNWIHFNVVKKNQSIDYYLSNDRQQFIATNSTQISRNIYLSEPIGFDNQYFYYAINPDWIDNHIDEFNELLLKYNRSDLVAYFDKNILNYNPIIIRIKFKD